MKCTIKIPGEEQEYESPEEAVLALLPLCAPTFLGKLKVSGLTEIENKLRGVVKTEEVGKNIVQSVS